MKHGHVVSLFEKELAAYCGARYAIALANGTATLDVALLALGVQPGDSVAVPPLTMSATTIAVLNAGAIPRYVDVDPRTWLMQPVTGWSMPVSLYGLHVSGEWASVDDAAQTLRPHKAAQFTSLSFQASKILATGEGGALLTNDEQLAVRAREISSLGYRMAATQSRIDPAAIKAPTYQRHYHRASRNYRMNDVTAELGLERLERADEYKLARRLAAAFYEDVVAGVDWITPQYVPEGWVHDRWTYAFAVHDAAWQPVLCDAIVRHGGEMPYGAWRLTYHEPAFAHLHPGHRPDPRSPRELPAIPTCPVAESLQPRLIQLQTNRIASAARNADALERAIKEIHG